MSLIDGLGLWVDRHEDRDFVRRSALFLDRDGVIIEDTGYVARARDVLLIPGAAECIAKVNQIGVPVVVVTNQSGIARGFFDWSGFEKVQQAMTQALKRCGAHVNVVLACGFHNVGSGKLAVVDHPWRKPNPGMLLKAGEMLALDLADSIMVGDRVSDLEAAYSAGLRRGILVRSGKAASEQGASEKLPSNFNWQVSNSLGDAADAILAQLSREP